jgi:hypothetical protein
LGISSASRVTPFLLTPSVLPLIPAGPAIEKDVTIASRRGVITKNTACNLPALFN